MESIAFVVANQAEVATEVLTIASEVTFATLERILSSWEFAHETLAPAVAELQVSSSSSKLKEFFIFASLQR
jgi:hypothetical protein